MEENKREITILLTEDFSSIHGRSSLFKYNENKFTQTIMSISIIFNNRKLFVIN